MKALSNSFTLTAVIDGGTYQATIRTSNDVPFLQFVNTSTGVVNPQWSSTTSPKFHLEVRDQSGSLVAYDTSSDKLKVFYGGSEASDTLIARAPTTTKVGNIEMPDFVFLKNVAGVGNQDDDYIYMTAEINASGQMIPVQSEVKTIQIRATSGGSAYAMNIETTNIVNQGEKGRAVAAIYDNNGSTVSEDRFNYKWYDITGSSEQEISGATSNTLEVSENDIDGFDVYRCVATLKADPDVTVSSVGGIQDFTDPYYVSVVLTSNTGVVGETIRNGEVYYAKAKVYNDDGTEFNKGTVSATIAFKDYQGATVTAPNLVEGKGYEIDYGYVTQTCGGKVTGYVTASVTLN